MIRIVTTLVTLLAMAQTAYSFEITGAQRQVIQTYMDCGRKWSSTYGTKLVNELADDIATASALKCATERESVMSVIRDISVYSDEEQEMSQLLDKQFRQLAISSVMDARMAQ